MNVPKTRLRLYNSCVRVQSGRLSTTCIQGQIHQANYIFEIFLRQLQELLRFVVKSLQVYSVFNHIAYTLHLALNFFEKHPQQKYQLCFQQNDQGYLWQSITASTITELSSSRTGHMHRQEGANGIQY